LLGEGYQVLNYGLSARTLLSTGDTPYTEEAFYQHSQTANPDILLVMLGTNDSTPHNWNAAAYDNAMDVDQTVIESEVVPIIKRVGARTDTPVIDVFSVTKDHSEYVSDGVHPNAIGLKLVAEKIHAGIIEQAHQYGW
jgi:acyl-CoA thioesterase-1